jgi:hypothetical protein
MHALIPPLFHWISTALCNTELPLLFSPETGQTMGFFMRKSPFARRRNGNMGSESAPECPSTS